MSEAQHSGTARAAVARLAEVDVEQSIALEPFRENGRNSLFLRLSPRRARMRTMTRSTATQPTFSKRCRKALSPSA
ncbi:MAG: hypothetical protein HPM95_05980 [Alphaproteobacteria bacterium]|nr:hypothetical protein [Alphaproteobacteria bacterium]